MRRRPVASSGIASIGYEESTSVLAVEFHNGGVYRYFMVAPSAFRYLLRAPSVGREFQTRVKDRYRTERVK